MSRLCATVFALGAVGMCAAQTPVPTTQSEQAAKQFRLTFVVTYPQGQQPTQSLVLDVPVMHDRPGMSGMNLAAGSIGEVEGSMQESLQCTDVRESATGLAVRVGFEMDKVLAPLPHSTEPVHRHLTFQRNVDLALGKPTRITEEMHAVPLGKGGTVPPNSLPAAPQISVTAVRM